MSTTTTYCPWEDEEPFEVTLPANTQCLGMRFSQFSHNRVRVDIVRPGGPVAKSGKIKPGTFLLKINGIEIDQSSKLSRMILIEKEKGNGEITLTCASPPSTDPYADAVEAAIAAKKRMSMQDKVRKSGLGRFLGLKKAAQKLKHKAELDRTAIVCPVFTVPQKIPTDSDSDNVRP